MQTYAQRPRIAPLQPVTQPLDRIIARRHVDHERGGRHDAFLYRLEDPPVHALRETEIVGVDPAQSFIDYARTRFSDPRIAFQVGDAMQLPFPSAHFDQTLSLLVMMFVPEPERAAREMGRVTRPGGTVSACTWHRDEVELTSIFWEEACKLDPGADARAQRPKHSNREGQLAALWKSAGLVDVEESAITMQLPFTSFSDFWDPHLRGVAPQGAYVASLSEERREALRRALHQRISGDRPDGAFSLKAKALAVRGTVPHQ